MKTGVLTFHAGFNHGAFLQAYALQKTLFQMGIDNLILDYQGIRQALSEYKCALVTREISLLGSRLGRVQKFREAHKRLIRSPKRFAIKGRPLRLDTIVFGSDEIWNLENCVFGHDTAYFGGNMPAINKISYAPSFGSTPGNIQLPGPIKSLLQSFRHISVRDRNSFEIIKNNLNAAPPIVPDPTFLCDIFQDAGHCNASPCVLVYALQPSSALIEDIKKHARKKNDKIIAVGYPHPWADENIINLSPFDLLGYYKKATFVVTDLFHGTIFSILANKNFMLEISGYRTNKFFPMLDILGVTDRVCTGKNIQALLATAINYDQVNMNVLEFKKAGLNFLAASLRDLI